MSTPGGGCSHLKSIYLIRHGQTSWSVSGQHTSRTEIPLTALGEQQARTLGDRLRTVTFDHIWVSPRLRAQRTLQLMELKTLPSIEEDLREWDYGDYEGRTSADIAKDNPQWNLWTDGCPNGEKPSDVSQRCDRLIERLRSLSGAVALFSHGHFCCALATRWIGLPIVNGQHLILDPASLSILGFPDHHPETTAIRCWNSV